MGLQTYVISIYLSLLYFLDSKSPSIFDTTIPSVKFSAFFARIIFCVYWTQICILFVFSLFLQNKSCGMYSKFKTHFLLNCYKKLKEYIGISNVFQWFYLCCDHKFLCSSINLEMRPNVMRLSGGKKTLVSFYTPQHWTVLVLTLPCRFLVPDNTQKNLTEIWHHFWLKNYGEK